MIQLILTDFDGTLFKKNGGELSAEFIQKMINLTNRGCLFAINSGRPYGTLKEFLRPLLSRTVFIANDGAEIMYKNCLLYKNPVDKRVALALCHAAADLKVPTFCALRERNLPIEPEQHSNHTLFGEEIYKLIFLKTKDIAATNQLKSSAKEKGLRICYEDETYLECCNATADKGVATAFLKQKFGITKNIAAFGDTAADFPMFDEADHVYLMRQANHLTYAGATVIDKMQEYIVNHF